jgi:hypothetical protein
VLTISWLAKWSISYYNDTANKAMARDDGPSPRLRWAGGVLLRGRHPAPTWILTGNTPKVAALVGLEAAATDGWFADTDTAATWLNDGVNPSGLAGVGRSRARRTRQELAEQRKCANTGRTVGDQPSPPFGRHTGLLNRSSRILGGSPIATRPP